jgi:hypothetical protein
MGYKNLTNEQFNALDSLKSVKFAMGNQRNKVAIKQAQAHWDAIKPK